MTEWKLPINQCVAIAKKRISDAAWILERYGSTHAALADACDLEREAREFLDVAASQGWAGNADALIAEQWAIYRT
jgi:hypothetical protein